VRLRLDSVSVSFLRNDVIKSVNLYLEEGEAILIAGPSGSGKTTLLRAIAGIIPEVYEGRLDGVIEPELQVRRSLVAYLLQEPWYGIASPYVWSEVTAFTNLSKLDEIKGALKDYGLSELLRRTTYTLSAGELQRLAVMVACYSQKKILLMDEPVSHLDPENSVKVRESLRKFINEGNSAIIVDHLPDFWDGIVSRAYIIKDGILTEYDEGIYAPYIKKINNMGPPQNIGDEVLNVSIEQYRHPGSRKTILHNVSITLNKGEIATLLGPSGVGKSTLLRTIASASIIPRKNINLFVKGNLLYIPDNPLLYYTEPTLLKELGERGIKLLDLFGLTSSATTPIGKLSTGERRRGALASVLLRKAPVVLMDEPTIGLDPINKAKVMEALVKVAEEGVGFLIATHDRDLLKISNKVYRLD